MKKKLHQLLLALTFIISSTLISQTQVNGNSKFVLYPSGNAVSKERIAQVVKNATTTKVKPASTLSNQAPDAQNDTISLCKNSTTTINVQNNDTDSNGDPLTTYIFAGHVNGAFSISGTAITYTPNNNYIGTDTIIYYVCDNGTPSLCDTAIVFIHVVGSFTTNLSVSICNGDSAFIAGAYHTLAGVFTNTLTATGGCDSILVTSLTVNPKPVATITPNGPTTFCQGDSVLLTSSTGTSYLWSTGAVTQSISVQTSGNYYVTVTNANGCSSTSPTVTVTVIPTLTVTPSSATICIGGSTTLTASGAISYIWGPSAGLNTTSGSTVVASPTLTTTYTVSGTSGLCNASKTVLVTVNPLPVVIITPSGPTTFCLGDSVKLTASASTTYSWSTGATTQTITVYNAGNYYVTETNTNNCSATSAITTVVVNPLPTASITPSGATTFCQGGSVILNANNGSSYLWFPTNETTQIITVTTSGTYSVAVANICGTATSTPVIVTVNPVPTVTITASGATTFCQGDSITLTSSSATSYSWDNGATTQSIKVGSTGNYFVTVTNSFSCSATSSNIVITVNQLAIASFNYGEVKSSMTYSFNNTSTNATAYTWSFGDGHTSTSANPTNSYAVGGLYTVTLTATNSCGPISTTQIIAVVDNSEFYTGFSPNGDGHNDLWNIPVLNDHTNNTVKVLNRWGSEVWQGINYDNTTTVWNGKNLSGDDLPDGTYFYIITYYNVDKRGWVVLKR